MTSDFESITDFGLFPARGNDTDYTRQPVREDEVELCREWIRLHCTPTKTIRTAADSYGLKHRVERWTSTLGKTFEQVDRQGRRWAADYHYVSNGAFIAAMWHEGYEIRRCSPGSPNACFNARYRRTAVLAARGGNGKRMSTNELMHALASAQVE
jgi:hypothetical protein